MEALVNELAECRYPLEELRETPAWKVRLVTSRLALRALLACVTLPLALAPDGTSKSAVIVVLAVSGGLYGPNDAGINCGNHVPRRPAPVP